MRIAGYTVEEVIYAAAETVVARARGGDGKTVVLKYQDGLHPSPDLDARWQHEHAVLQSIRSEFIVQALGLEQVEKSLVLLLEDFGSANLAQVIARRQLDMAERIAFAIQLTMAVSAVHQHHLIHGDLSSKNVLVDVSALKLKLCDFALATRLDREHISSQDGVLRGTLEYMSPEQTGRTNLDVDYRSDLYSLGVTLYELFSGVTPFRSSDPMTLVHAQIATLPVPLSELDPSIPGPLSGVVQKLLSKSPDDRYQSTFGLSQDLATCAQHWHRHRRIEPFPLATNDVPERFSISQRLYGREAETAGILAAFERVSGGRAELLLISGYSGIGKTALVSELNRPIVARRGYFVRGKQDQYSRNQPYSALIQALQQLLRQLAGEGDERRHYWRTSFLSALGENVAAVTAILPNLIALTGEPPPLPSLPAAEEENRFHIAFARFVRALASPVHPIVLFLDDLQWADQPTLRLLEHLIGAGQDLCLLIIGAYRDNEVDDAHPLRLAIQAVERAEGPVVNLRLGNLELEHVARLVADTLRAVPEDVAPLAALCLEKTRGNPFFLGQFLKALEQTGDIHYVRSVGGWRWNIEQIRRRDMTDNVVGLMLEKLRTLPRGTQALLARAAHLGGGFHMRELMAVGGRGAIETAEELWPALSAGLVIPLDEDYKFAGNEERLRASSYRFLHDRVQQAAYDLTAESDRPGLRLESGRRLLSASSESELEARLFTILDLLNSAVDLIQGPAERERLLELDLRGGVRAKSASAYATAVSLLRRGKELLAADAWQTHPARTLALYKELAEAEYLSGNFDEAEKLYPEGVAATEDAIARATLRLVQADQYQIQGRFGESLPVLLSALSLLGR
ncbi:MAG: serine/threonine-protein kinase PknK, partial [Acidobacteria bacterium]|nr:serine/threonine-protein kinase PknK [Acidobacteriota bacterium]